MRPDFFARKEVEPVAAQNQGTGSLGISGKVVDLNMYRALRSLTARTSAVRSRARYVLWYPGIGCFYPLSR
jgi:hypothetical protein